MNKFIKTLLCSLLVLSMSACQTTQPKPVTNTTQTEENKKNEASFTKFLDDYLVDILSSDFTSLQQYVEHPENFGIKREDIEVSLGHIASTQEDIQDNQDWLDQLHSFDFDQLSKTEQVIYKNIENNLLLSSKMMNSKFDYTGNVWGSISGLHENLVSFFSEYSVKDKQDIEDLITLINDVPRYVNEALDYTKEQAKQGTLCFDYDTVLTNIQEIIDSKETSSIITELNKEIDDYELSEQETKEYKKQIKDALNKNFFPSYETMKDTLTSLKSKVKPITGLANIENGKEYYELLIENATGSTESISTIQKNLQDAADDAQNKLIKTYNEDPLAYVEMNYISTGFNNIDDILPALKKSIEKDFPKVEKLDYELNALNDDQSTEGVVAYCVVPAFDASKPTQIRYNKRDYGKDADSIELYTTLAHEGIPGHMYQFAYVLENMEHPIQYMFSNNGFTEGYATYVQFQALNYLEDSSSIKMYKYNEILTYMYICLMDIDVNYNGYSLKQFTTKYSELFGSDLSGIYNQLADNPSTFLSYYYGFLQIMNLRSNAKKQLGDKFKNIEFNDALLKYGSVTFDLVEQNINEYIEKTK